MQNLETAKDVRWLSLKTLRRFLIAAFLMYFAICCLTNATTHIDQYDGSFNSMVAKNIAFNGRFQVLDYDEYIVWPVKVTTGPTLLLPVALGFKLLGDNPFVPNITCAIISVLLLTMICLVLARSLQTLSSQLSFALALFLLCTTVIKPFSRFWLPMGDVPAGLLLLLATFLLFSRREAPTLLLWHLPLAGAIAGLAVSCKVIAIVPTAFLGAALFVSPPVSSTRFRTVGLWLIGLLVVIGVFECYRFFELGSFHAYVDNWHQFIEFLARQGSDLGASRETLTSRLSSRTQMVFSHLGWLAPVLAFTLVIWPVFVRRVLTGCAQSADRLAFCLGMLILPLLAWWFVMSARNVIRHIVPALILLPLYVHFALMAISASSSSMLIKRGVLAAWAVGVAIALSASPSGTCVIPRPSTDLTPRTVALFQAAAKIRAFQSTNPTARFWSSGWWRHWDLQRLVDFRLSNLLDPHPRGHSFTRSLSYLITSDYFDWEQRPRITAILEANKENCVFRNSFFAFYELKSCPFPSEVPHISAYGPHRARAGESFNTQPDGSSAIWIKVSTPASPYVKIRWNGEELNTCCGGNSVLTASIPHSLIRTPQLVRIELFDSLTGAVSPAIELLLE